MTQRLGVSLPLDGLTLQECLELAQYAETLGFTDVWTSEIGGADGFSLLAAIAVRTERLRLGVGVVPVYTRPPALIAMSAAALQSLSGGRFSLGLGTSTEIVVEQWMGLSLDRPLARMRETVEAVQLALSGSKVSLEGETLHMQEFRLQLPDVEPVAVLLGALGPRMIELAGEIADGVILSQAGRSALPTILEDYWMAVESSGRERDDVEVVQRIAVAVDEEEDTLRQVFRRELAGYGRTKFYNDFFVRQGLLEPEEASAMREAWARGEGRAAAATISDRMVEQCFVFGSADVCRARLAEYRRAGITTPVIIPVSIDPDPEVRHTRRRQVLETLARV